MRKRLLPLLLALVMLTAVGCNLRNVGPTISFSENGVLTVEIPTNKSGSITLPQPAGTHAPYCVGWAAQVADSVIFLPVGATFSYNRGDSIHFTPVYLHLITLADTEIDLTDEEGALRYTTTMNVGEWNKLLDLGANPQAGTLMVPQSLTAGAHSLTHDYLGEDGLALAQDDMTELERDATSFTGAFRNISVGNRLTPYTGIGYVKLTYSDGSTAYVYAKPQQNKTLPSASLLGLSKIAIEDLADKQDDVYITQVGDKFSPYTPEEYTLLQSFSKITLTLCINYNMRGNRGLTEDFGDAFIQRTIQNGDAKCAEEWRILRGMITDISQDGALVITAKDGTAIERDNVSDILFQNKVATVRITNAVYYNGSIYIPYSTYTPNY